MNSVAVSSSDSQFKFHKKKLVKLTQSVLKKLGYKSVQLSLVFVTDSEIKRLNKKHLNHSWVTDVLAFPFKGSNQNFIGEVIISPKRAKIYSQKFNISYQEELVRYICHGILHLKGYSDHSKKARQIMEQKENLLIRSVARLTEGPFNYGH